MQKKPESKVVRITDFERATSHSWLVTLLGDSHPVTSKGYRENETMYTLLSPSKKCASHDLYQLKDEAGMTPGEFEYLNETSFSDLEDGKEVEV